MKNPIYLFAVLFIYSNLSAQTTLIQLEGSIQVGHSENETPPAGTIRWDGFDLQGFNGERWVSLSSGATKPLKDIDDNIYQTVGIGDQIWMAENLRTTKYADGTPIPNVTDAATWDGLTTGAFCWYENNSTYDVPYGKLYNYYAVQNTSGICPEGWKVPSKSDLDALIDFLGGSEIAGGKMKEIGTEHWISPNDGATNESGFTGLGYGGRFFNGEFIDSQFFGYFANFWSTTAFDADKIWYLYLSKASDDANMSTNFKRYGLTIRCLRD